MSVCVRPAAPVSNAACGLSSPSARALAASALAAFILAALLPALRYANHRGGFRGSELNPPR